VLTFAVLFFFFFFFLFSGHGIGSTFHPPPSIPHYARNKAVGQCKPGMVFTIEPMINMGTWKDVTWTFDDWTSVTADGKRSAQFEHTVLVTEKGVEILTARTKESPPLWWEVDQAASSSSANNTVAAPAAAAASAQ
jgi:methionyl aminopeptidase